ncbi:MAG: hypothetical protein WBO58_08915 [Gammaproteobacteria bacterium]
MGNNLAVKQGLPRWPSAGNQQEADISNSLRNLFQGLKQLRCHYQHLPWRGAGFIASRIVKSSIGEL